jgi:uncharacterized protein YukE
MRVDVDALRSAVPDLDAVAAAVDITLTHLHDALTAEGECWGRGGLGSAFASGYGQVREQAEQAFGDLSRGIAAMGAAFGSVADAAQAVDARAADRLT